MLLEMMSKMSIKNNVKDVIKDNIKNNDKDIIPNYIIDVLRDYVIKSSDKRFRSRLHHRCNQK